MHQHTSSHAGHCHGHSHGKNAPHKVLMIAIVLTFSFAIVEAMGGWWSGSLALLSDAGHMVSDSLALLIAAFAAWIARKPPSSKHSYGLGRAEVVAAWVSSLLMLIISVAVIVEAVARIHDPMPVKGLPVMVIAFIGLLVNLLIAWLLARGERTINIRAALLHVMGDVLGSMSALVAGAVIYFTGWFPIDPILSILIGVLIMVASLRLLRESLLILMEGVPQHIDINQVENSMLQIGDVQAVHDLHVWTLSSGRVALSAHVNIHEFSHWPEVLQQLKDRLNDAFSITHITLQPEPDIIDCNPC